MFFDEFLSIVFFLMIFAAVLFLAYIFTRFIGDRASKAMRGKYIQIVESVSLGLDKRLLLVKVAHQFILLASCGKNLEYIATVKLDDFTEEQERETGAGQFNFKAVFEKYLGNLKSVNKLENTKKELERKTGESKTTPESIFKNNLARLRTITKRVETNDTDCEDTAKKT